MRLNESNERAKRYAGKIDEDLYEPHEIMRKYPKYLGKKGVRFKLPILNWTEQEVFSFLDGEQNPLYAAGFNRVGCFPCLAAGDAYKEKAFKYDDFGKQQYEQVIQVSKVINKSIWTSKGGIERNGCQICEI
jgi:3'-phosphoadenosine 5'-phosphosulfate sulfotransferase (PAPS reductase)/FAD synthetase